MYYINASTPAAGNMLFIGVIRDDAGNGNVDIASIVGGRSDSNFEDSVTGSKRQTTETKDLNQL